jgi:hypothetical protein
MSLTQRRPDSVGVNAERGDFAEKRKSGIVLACWIDFGKAVPEFS